MPRSPRADEAGGLYHALNRANLGAKAFLKEGDYRAFEKVLHEALQIYQVELYCYQIIPPIGTWSCVHYLYQGRFKSFPIQDDEHFLVVCRYVERNALRAGLVDHAEQWRWSSLFRWLQPTEPEPKLLSSWPIPRLPNWVERVNQALSDQELKAIRNCAQRGAPLGDEGWVESIARRLDLESTMRPRGRPRVRPLPKNGIKEV